MLKNIQTKEDMRLYRTIDNIKTRCYNKNCKDYMNYGGRGISLCEDWRHSNYSFISWAKRSGYKHGMEIDRIDNNKGYSPENCRFVTHKMNNRNTRKNRFIEYNGEKLCVSEWAERLNCKSGELYRRIYMGWEDKMVIEKSIRSLTS